MALADRGAPLVRRWSADDVGLLPAHDAAWLPGGRLLVALGELGARLYTRDGRVAAHLDQPAAELVVSDLGTRALALSPRGEYLRVARLDLATRRAAHWCDARCDGGARTYDGETWLTTRGSEVLAIDTHAARWTASWGVELEHHARAIRRDRARWSVEAAEMVRTELWFYEGFILRSRREVTLHEGEGTLTHLVAARPERTDWIELAVPAERPSRSTLWIGDHALALDLGVPRDLELDARFVAIAGAVAGGQAVTVVHAPQRKVIAQLALEGASRAHLRLTDFILVVCDDRGRVIALDLRTGTVRADLRLTV